MSAAFPADCELIVTKLSTDTAPASIFTLVFSSLPTKALYTAGSITVLKVFTVTSDISLPKTSLIPVLIISS